MQFDLEVPQFLTAELLACVPGLGGDAFKQWLQRRTVVLSTGENIGRGRKPVYRGTDVIQVAAIHELTRQGMMASRATLAWQMAIAPRLRNWRTSHAMHQPPYNRSVFFGLDPQTDELIAKEFSEGIDDPLDHPDAPNVLILFRTDRFIIRMIERMQKIKGGLPASDAAPPPSPIEADFAYHESLNAVERDAAGNRVLIGLTRDKTLEYFALSNRLTQNRAGAKLFSSFEEEEAANQRVEELYQEHFAAMSARSTVT
jgi:hypothetical protein